MKNKGFTLMELLGVIIILSVLILITFPIILNQVKNAKQEIKDSTKVLIIDAAKDYYSDNINNYETYEGMTYCININTLSEQGYLNKKIKDENLNDINTSKNVKLIYHNAKFDYDIVDSCQTYTVTFDANGGTVDVESKEVTQDSVYGTLPTPTRAGYTFMGWNGKNIINIDEAINDCLIDNGDGTYTMWYNDKGRFAYNLYVSIPENTTLTFSYDLVDYNGTYFSPLQILGKYTDNDKIYFSSNKRSTTLTKELSRLSIYQEGSQPIGTYTKFKNLQLEEGDTATEYEPYFIKENTKIVQNNNHTLKAIWKANE